MTEDTRMTIGKVERMLTWAYKQARSSHGPIDSAVELAESYQGRHGSPRRDADALIRWQTAKAAGWALSRGCQACRPCP